MILVMRRVASLPAAWALLALAVPLGRLGLGWRIVYIAYGVMLPGATVVIIRLLILYLLPHPTVLSLMMVMAMLIMLYADIGTVAAIMTHYIGELGDAPRRAPASTSSTWRFPRRVKKKSLALTSGTHLGARACTPGRRVKLSLALTSGTHDGARACKPGRPGRTRAAALPKAPRGWPAKGQRAVVTMLMPLWFAIRSLRGCGAWPILPPWLVPRCEAIMLARTILAETCRRPSLALVTSSSKDFVHKAAREGTSGGMWRRGASRLLPSVLLPPPRRRRLPPRPGRQPLMIAIPFHVSNCFVAFAVVEVLHVGCLRIGGGMRRRASRRWSLPAVK